MPIYKCSNGKYRIGTGSCIYDTHEKAAEVWAAILASGKMAAKKVSYDYDGVLSTDAGKEKANKLKQIDK
jgi:Ni,Fe-hydrogenase I small subunit